MAALARIRSVKLTGGVNVPLEFIMLVFAALPAIVPLLAQGYLRGADYMDTPWRSLELLEALKEGVLFPRWSPDLFYGFGFPIFNFYSPMSFYEVVAMRIIGAPDLLQASKSTFALNFLASGIGGYVLARCIGLGRAPAAAAGVLYMYAPSTLRDVYIRSGLASLTGTAFLPLVLTAFVHLCRVRSMTSTAVAALMLSLMILTHNLTSVVALGMIVVLVLVHCLWNHDIRALTPAVLAVALGLGVASFFILPAMTETALTHTEKLAAGDLDYRLHFVDPLGDINGTIESRAVDIKYMATRWGGNRPASRLSIWATPHEGQSASGVACPGVHSGAGNSQKTLAMDCLVGAERFCPLLPAHVLVQMDLGIRAIAPGLSVSMANAGAAGTVRGLAGRVGGAIAWEKTRDHHLRTTVRNRHCCRHLDAAHGSLTLRGWRCSGEQGWPDPSRVSRAKPRGNNGGRTVPAPLRPVG